MWPFQSIPEGTSLSGTEPRITLAAAANLPAVAAEQLVRGYISKAKAANTVRAYAADWRHFTAWCGRRGAAPMPATPATVSLYLAELADSARISTLTRRVSAISQAHQLAGFASPTEDARVRTVMAGIRRA